MPSSIPEKYSRASPRSSRYEEFKKYLGRRTLAGNYHTGVVFGGLLLDVLLIIDGVTAIAQPHANGYHFQKPLPAVGWEDKLGPQSCAGARPIQLPDLIRAVG